MPEKERVYTIEVNLESNDEVDLSHFLHWIAEDIEAGRLRFGKKEYANQNNVKGSVVLKEEVRCTVCEGMGEVAEDATDKEGNIERGVNTKKCLCLKSTK